MPARSHPIWTELFHRAEQEEIGIAIRTNNAKNAVFALHDARPPGFQDYTITETADPNLLYITKPTVTLEDYGV